MICYRDMQFCTAGERCVTPDCDRRLTPEVREQARRWWEGFEGPEHGGAPISQADRSEHCTIFQPAEEPAAT